jgi:hypothetical protein
LILGGNPTLGQLGKPGFDLPQHLLRGALEATGLVEEDAVLGVLPHVLAVQTVVT